MSKIVANKVLFIKLGEKGVWEDECITQGILKLGFREADFTKCITGDWAGVGQDYIAVGKDKSTASRWTGEIRYFFEEPKETLWITFHKMKLWWAFADTAITLMPDGTKTRKVIGSWSDKDVNGKLLTFDNLSGKLTKTQGYRGTICEVGAADYLLHKLNAEYPPYIIQANNSYNSLKASIEELIKELGYKDFEILVDMIFRAAGWQRMGVVGKTEKDLDLDLVSPVTHERAFVQIKSQSDFAGFQDYLGKYKGMEQFHKFFFVVHTTTDKKLLNAPSTPDINIWNVAHISKMVVDAGLSEWVIKKAF